MIVIVIYLVLFVSHQQKTHISKLNSTSAIIHTFTPTPMSTPPNSNSPPPQPAIPDTPLQLSVEDDLFNAIIDNLNDPVANSLRHELRPLLHIRGDHNRNFQVIRLIRQLQHVLRHHPNSRDLNVMLHYPIPNYDRPFPLRPGYATGEYDIVKEYYQYSPESGGYGPHRR
jgi:hypothetical protein